jgi:hypothetical protein
MPDRIASSNPTAGKGAGVEVFEAALEGLGGSSARATLAEIARLRVASQSRKRRVDFMAIAFPCEK